MKWPQSVVLVDFGTRCQDFCPNHVLCGSVRIMHQLQLMSPHGWSRKNGESNDYISVEDVITSLLLYAGRSNWSSSSQSKKTKFFFKFEPSLFSSPEHLNQFYLYDCNAMIYDYLYIKLWLHRIKDWSWSAVSKLFINDCGCCRTKTRRPTSHFTGLQQGFWGVLKSLNFKIWI